MLQPLHWRCIKCAIHHEQDVREEQHPYIYMWREQAIIVIAVCDFYCCLLPQCETLHTCHSGFSIATLAYVESDRSMWFLLLLAATVWNFARLPLGLSDHNNMLPNVWKAGKMYCKWQVYLGMLIKFNCLMPVLATFIASNILPIKWNFYQNNGSSKPRLVAVVCILKCFGNDLVC